MIGNLALVLSAYLAGGCAERNADPVSVAFTGMGTLGSLIVPAGNASNAASWCGTVTACVSRLEGQLSIFKPGSDLARVNASAGGEGVDVAPDTRAMLERGLQASRDSGGAFDMTVGPLMALWGFRGSNSVLRLPTESERAETLQRVGAEHVVISGQTVRLDRPGVRLDAGGIGKGFAVDRCWEELRRQGARSFLVNLGGNMRASGRPSPDRPWIVGVRHPFDANGLLGRMRLPDGMAVATSGHYERFVIIGGVRYAHIMDPRTGAPVQGMAGVTVAAPTATEADILSTALFVMGPEQGLAMLKRTGRKAEALFVYDRQPLVILVTPGMADLFEPARGLVVRNVGW
jgi:thiamine biosynthesis lipoprotein